MWLYRHHTCGDIIDLDHASGRWRPVDDSEKPAGARLLDDLPTRGSYEIEDDRRYCKYWTDDNAYVFRTPDDQVFEICRKLKDGSIIESHPGLHLVIEDAKYADGRLRQGYSDVRLVDRDGKILYELSYNSQFYLRLYSSDLTAASMIQDLSDWDFFVALKGGLEIFAERAVSGRIQITYDDDGNVKAGALLIPKALVLFADTGETCPKAGTWAYTDDIRKTVPVRQGQAMPKLDDEPACWMWLPDDEGSTATASTAAQSGASSGLLSGETGEVCPQDGIWGVVGDPWETAMIGKGEPFPPSKGRRVQWVWCRNQ